MPFDATTSPIRGFDITLEDLYEQYGREDVDRQLELESDMRSYGMRRFEKIFQKAREKENLSETSIGGTLVSDATITMRDAIDAFMAEANSGRAGRRNIAVKYLDKLPAMDIAFITSGAIIDHLGGGRVTLTKTAIGIANAVQDEAYFREFREASKGVFKQTQRRLNKLTPNYRYKANVMRRAARQQWVAMAEWPAKDRLAFGIKLIELFQIATGLVEVATISNKGQNLSVVRPTEKTEEWLRKTVGRLGELSPGYQPMVIPPRPWTSPFMGGYWSDRITRKNLVKSWNRQYLLELEAASPQAIYAAVNAVQETPWRINRRVLEIMQGAWERDLEIGGIPRSVARELPERPDWIIKGVRKADLPQDHRLALGKWLSKTRTIRDENQAESTRRISFSKSLGTALKYEGYDAIYFPHSLDFRGRMYPIPMFLHPQGSDEARGVLEFANAAPLGDAEGVRWLAIHGANCFGYDKVSFEDRVEWVEHNSGRISRIAADPWADLWWSEADKPWQFLAWCFEWAGYLKEGTEFLSCVPVQMDGTCNGIQHFSAMLRDPIGGRAVNLVPGEVPSDIYNQVAEVVLVKVREDARDGVPCAAEWLDLINRKVVKRPVMTLPYGATKRGYIEQILEDTVDPLGDASPWERNWDGAAYLAEVLWGSVGEVVVAARAAMGWLQDVARILADHNAPLRWTVPTGLPVVQAYQKVETKQIELTFLKKSIRPRIDTNKGEKKLNRRAQLNGVAPNFVHSMDAAHLKLTVNECHAQGVRSFSMIHDSYGTHAGNASILASALREVFVQMYLEGNVLEDLRDELSRQLPEGVDELPHPPAMGTLDVAAVLESPFFFA